MPPRVVVVVLCALVCACGDDGQLRVEPSVIDVDDWNQVLLVTGLAPSTYLEAEDSELRLVDPLTASIGGIPCEVLDVSGAGFEVRLERALPVGAHNAEVIARGESHVGVDALTVVPTGTPRDGGRSDGGRSDGGRPDASQNPPRLGPYSTAVPIAELNTPGDEDDPTLTADMLEIHFNRDGDIYSATRANVDDPWSPPARVDELSTPSFETSPEVAPDGLTIWFSRSAGSFDIYTATRPDRGAPWGMPTSVDELSTSRIETNPAPSEDMLRLVIARGTTLDAQDLFVAERSSLGASWGMPMPLSELNTPGNAEGGPILRFGPRLIAFDSDRRGMGGEDIWYATRATAAEPFGAAVAVPDINTAADEGDPWLSPDGRVIFFNRGADLYQSTSSL